MVCKNGKKLWMMTFCASRPLMDCIVKTSIFLPSGKTLSFMALIATLLLLKTTLVSPSGKAHLLPLALYRQGTFVYFHLSVKFTLFSHFFEIKILLFLAFPRTQFLPQFNMDHVYIKLCWAQILKIKNKNNWKIKKRFEIWSGREIGIRTPGGFHTSTVFKTAAFDRSAISRIKDLWL